MSLPNTLKELQNLCEDNGIRFKGKTKAQLRELLGEKNIQAEKDDLEHKSVKELKEMCDRKGISKTGNKEEIRKRLKSADKVIHAQFMDTGEIYPCLF